MPTALARASSTWESPPKAVSSWACKCPLPSNRSAHPRAASLVVAGCAQSRPLSMASQACVWPGPSASVALPRDAVSCPFSADADARPHHLVRGGHVRFAVPHVARASLVVRPGLQRLRLCGCGSLSRVNESDAGGVLGGVRFGVCGRQASPWLVRINIVGSAASAPTLLIALASSRLSSPWKLSSDVFCYRNCSICRFRGPFANNLAEGLKIKVY